MDLQPLKSPPPRQNIIVAKAVVLFVLILIIFLGQYWLPKPSLDRAKAPLEISPQVLGLRSEINPQAPLEKLELSFNEKLDAQKLALAARIADKKNALILALSDQVATASSTLRKKLLEFYLTRLFQGLPQVLPSDQDDIKSEISTLLFATPEIEPTSSSYLELPLLTPINLE